MGAGQEGGRWKVDVPLEAWAQTEAIAKSMKETRAREGQQFGPSLSLCLTGLPLAKAEGLVNDLMGVPQ